MIGAAAGIGLRHPHLPALAAEDADARLCVPWVEIHSENFLCDGGPRLAMLDAVAARYPMSCHGVGLSLGSAEGLDAAHLARLKNLFARAKPKLISEHLSWSVTGGVYLNDLLPLPFAPETLSVVARNIDAAQNAFGQKILIENPSTYVTFSATSMSETEFLARLVERTGCGLLLDVNNIYVSACNNGFDATAYISEIPAGAVGEIHLAGHSVGNDAVLIDTHSTHVCDDVWALYRAAISHVGPRPTLIEWDSDIPELPMLLAEAARAQSIMDQRHDR
jgi:uncharacterized protein (UPF0276 family)